MWTREADSQLDRCKNKQMTAKFQDLFLDASGDSLEPTYSPRKEQGEPKLTEVEFLSPNKWGILLEIKWRLKKNTKQKSKEFCFFYYEKSFVPSSGITDLLTGSPPESRECALLLFKEVHYSRDPAGYWEL